jgi:long-chain acyl-CoA synthetase
MYTSGTTGKPKGVMLSHRSHLSIIRDLGERIAPEAGFKGLSYLPLNHIFERTVSFMYQSKGVSIYYAEGLANIQANFMEVQPNIIATVPLLLEKVYGQILAYANKFEGAQREMYESALKIATEFTFDSLENPEFKAKYDLVNEHVFSKWRGFLGGNLKRIICGGAAMQKQLFNLFWASGIPIMQGYGLSETSGLIAIDRYGSKIILNKCGKPMNDIDVKIAEDGEIMARGIPLMLGYYKQPELTAQEMDADGWFHTGDFGELDEEYFLQFKGRKKAYFKNSSGLYINPEHIENTLKKNPAIKEVVITGQNQPYLGALILPNKTLSKEEYEATITGAIKAYNASQVYETHQILSYLFLESEWTIDGGELTPTMKIRRNNILEKHRNEINELFKDQGKAIRIETSN